MAAPPRRRAPRRGRPRRGPRHPRRQRRRAPPAPLRRLRPHLHRPALQHRARAAPRHARGDARHGRRAHGLRRPALRLPAGALAGLRRRLRRLPRVPRAAPPGGQAPARAARNALLPLRPARGALLQAPARRGLWARGVPQRDRLGLRLRRQAPPALARQARHDPRLRPHARRASLRRRRGRARALHGPWARHAEQAARGKRPTDTWWHTIVPTNGAEKTGYPTQKPEGIVRRMVAASSRPGGWCLDFFAGSGTLGAVCTKLGRCVLVDASGPAVAIMVERLGAAPGPFTVS